jgi:hypothetical protein
VDDEAPAADKSVTLKGVEDWAAAVWLVATFEYVAPCQFPPTFLYDINWKS